MKGIGHTIEGKQPVSPEIHTRPSTPIRLTTTELEALDWGFVDEGDTKPTFSHSRNCPRYFAEGAD